MISQSFDMLLFCYNLDVLLWILFQQFPSNFLQFSSFLGSSGSISTCEIGGGKEACPPKDLVIFRELSGQHLC